MSYQIADTRKSTSLIKKYLTSKYGVKFTVRTDKFSGGDSLDIDWTMGPSSKVIDNEVARLQEGHFDGMIDMYEYSNVAERGMVIDGYHIETRKYVFCKQSIPNSIMFAIAKKMSDKWSFADGDYVIPKLETVEQMNDTFKMRYGNAWTWREMAYQNWENRNFVTDDPEQVEILDVEWDDSYLRRLVVTYKYDGQIYTTADLKIAEPAVKKEKVIVINDVRMVDYSEKSVAVIGSTYEIKEQLKEIGGKFNKFLKIDGNTVAGWIFSKTKESEISDLLIEYSKK